MTTLIAGRNHGESKENQRESGHFVFLGALIRRDGLGHKEIRRRTVWVYCTEQRPGR